MCIRGHSKINIEGADVACRLIEDVTFGGLPLAYLLAIKLNLSYDPAIYSVYTRS